MQFIEREITEAGRLFEPSRVFFRFAFTSGIWSGGL